MAQFKLSYNKTTKVALVQLPATAVPGGYVNVGTFEHADVEPALKDLEFDTNHVIYHHVRDILYTRSAADPAQTAKFPNNITDMGSIRIAADANTNLPIPAETEGAD